MRGSAEIRSANVLAAREPKSSSRRKLSFGRPVRGSPQTDKMTVSEGVDLFKTGRKRLYYPLSLFPDLRGQVTFSDGAVGTSAPAKSHPTNPLPSSAPQVTPPITAELFTAKLDGT